MTNFFHSSASIGKFASIEVSSRGTNTVIGQLSVIDDFVKIKHVAGGGDVVIGDFVYINSGSVLYSGNGISIGNNVLIGPNCNLVPVNHNFYHRNEVIRLQGYRKSLGGIVIEDDVWLGANVTVLDGAFIRKGCVIAAHSLIMGNTVEYGVYAGSPAKLVKMRP